MVPRRHRGGGAGFGRARAETARTQPASLSDVDAPTAEEGRPIPVVFGTVLLRGSNVVWYGDLEADPIKKKGGKK